MKINKVTIHDSLYPAALKDIASPPKVLYVLGNVEPLANTRTVSIVGSRAVTPYGRQITTMLATDIASRGMAIISGLALGVDALAHQAAVNCQGYTIAVLASGLDIIQPSSNRNLALAILKSGGAIISEYPEETIPFKQHFVARNRIVSALGDGLLITEAGEYSGSLHTANFALEQGKAVMAVPGNITSGNSRGTNNLIKTGAIPVTDIADVLNALQLEEKTTQVNVVAANIQEAQILDHMKHGITDINQLQLMSKLSPDVFNQTITMLEITAKIRPLGAGHWGIT
jgi:DNA processing protein